MRGIKHVLTERQYAWEDAVKLAESDPEINVSGEGPAFTPSEYLEEAEDILEETEAIEAEESAGTGKGESKADVPLEAQTASSPDTKRQSETCKL